MLSVLNITVDWKNTNMNTTTYDISNKDFIHVRFTPGFNGLGKGNCKTGRQTFKFRYANQP